MSDGNKITDMHRKMLRIGEQVSIPGNWDWVAEFREAQRKGEFQAALDQLEAMGEVIKTGEIRNGQPVYVSVKKVGRA